MVPASNRSLRITNARALLRSRACILVVLAFLISCRNSTEQYSIRDNDCPRLQAPALPVAPVIPDELVTHINSTMRAEWYPAAGRLGAIAQQNQTRRAVVWAQTRVNTLGMKFSAIPAGTFRMGPSPMPFAEAWGEVGHWVTISNGFLLSVTEVTNSQFAHVFPDHKPHSRSPLADSPVIVNWSEAARFCELLSEREGSRYRLPTEAEWEYACRAGSTTAFSFGDDPSLLAEYAWYGKCHENAAQVASFKPNAWGLYDMHGNALEWTADWYRVDAYRVRSAAGSDICDPQGPTSGIGHVLRGGDWACWEPLAFASSKRTRMPLFPLCIEMFDPQFPKTHETTGFRVVRECDE